MESFAQQLLQLQLQPTQSSPQQAEETRARQSDSHAPTAAAAAAASAAASSSSPPAWSGHERMQGYEATGSSGSEPGAPVTAAASVAASVSAEGCSEQHDAAGHRADGASLPDDSNKSMAVAAAAAATGAGPAPVPSPSPSVASLDDDSNEPEIIELTRPPDAAPPAVPVALVCPLCSLFLYSPVTLLCGHSACSRCVQTMLKLRAPMQRHQQLLLACVCCGKLSTVDSTRCPSISLKSTLEHCFPRETALASLYHLQLCPALEAQPVPDWNAVANILQAMLESPRYQRNFHLRSLQLLALLHQAQWSSMMDVADEVARILASTPGFTRPDLALCAVAPPLPVNPGAPLPPAAAMAEPQLIPSHDGNQHLHAQPEQYVSFIRHLSALTALAPASNASPQPQDLLRCIYAATLLLRFTRGDLPVDNEVSQRRLHAATECAKYVHLFYSSRGQAVPLASACLAAAAPASSSSQQLQPKWNEEIVWSRVCPAAPPAGPALDSASFSAASVLLLDNPSASAMLSELGCLLCMNPLYDPVTTVCGHSLCRGCLARSLDYKNQCPSCRSLLSLHISPERQSVSEALRTLALMWIPRNYDHRRRRILRELQEQSLYFPIFVCSLSFPGQSYPLHIFEPRYRLLIRSVMESGFERFGMCAHTMDAAGNYSYGEVGVCLHIRRIEVLPDGRMLVDTVAGRRFQVQQRSERNGYAVAKVAWFDDLPAADQTAMFASAVPSFPALLHEVRSTLLEGILPQVAASLPGHVLASMPPLDRLQDFAYWIAGILPLQEEDKYELLQMRTEYERYQFLLRYLRPIHQVMLAREAARLAQLQKQQQQQQQQQSNPPPPPPPGGSNGQGGAPSRRSRHYWDEDDDSPATGGGQTGGGASGDAGNSPSDSGFAGDIDAEGSVSAGSPASDVRSPLSEVEENNFMTDHEPPQQMHGRSPQQTHGRA